ncbi:MAG: site-2 protease family protein [Candidatus Eremiobacterota bacterium]
MSLDWLARNAVGILAVLAAFGFIIFIHEMGHFLVARRVGIRCPMFAIGFGPKFFSFRWKGTEFSVRMFPFGGFVLMVGEDPGSQDSWHSQLAHYLADASLPARPAELLAYLDELEKTRGDALEQKAERERFEEVREHLRYLEDRLYASLDDLEGNFNHKTIPQRIAVTAGGVVMNFIAAILIMWVVGFTWGMPQVAPLADTRVTSLVPGGPAEKAGIKPGDIVVSVDGQRALSGPDMIRLIGEHPADPIVVQVERKGQTLDFTLTPNAWTEDGEILFESGPSGGIVTGKSDAKEPPFEAGARVVAVQGHPVADLPQLVDAIGQAVAGKPPDQKVTLAFELEGKGRKEVTRETSKWKLMGKIGIKPHSLLVIRLVPDFTNVVDSVAPGSPADRAGFQVGDEILDIQDLHVFGQQGMDETLAQTGATVTFRVMRAGAEEPPELTVTGHVANLEQLGIRLRPLTAGEVLASPFKMIVRVVLAPVTILVRSIQKTLPWSDIKEGTGGPVAIMKMIFDVTALGLGQFLFIVAFINAAVGGFNLIPFPALDGARILILTISGIRGKEFDPEKEAKVHYVGLMVLLALVVVITFNDISRMFSGAPMIK